MIRAHKVLIARWSIGLLPSCYDPPTSENSAAKIDLVSYRVQRSLVDHYSGDGLRLRIQFPSGDGRGGGGEEGGKIDTTLQ